MKAKYTHSIIKQLETAFREQWENDALTDYGSGVTYKYRDIAIRICYFHMLFETLDRYKNPKVTNET